jgi:hypothetical protein
MNQIINEKKFISERTGIPFSNLSQAYLRAETKLGSLSSYDFELQKNNVASPTVTERLLNLNDEFVITHMTIALKATPSTETDAEHLAAVLSNYAGNNEGAISNGEAVYNSSLSMTIDRKEFLPQYDTRFFRRVPTTQVSDLTNVVTENDVPNGLYGFAPFEPVKIDGRQTIDTTLDLGSAVTIAGPTSFTSAFACLIVRGYLVVNAKS